MRYSLRVLFPWTVVVLLILGLSGCSGSAGTQASTSENMTLRVGQISKSIAYFPFYVAEQKGFFKAQKLDIGTPPLLGTGAKVVTALRAGSLDIGGGVVTDVFNAAKTDTNTKIIGALVNSYYIDLVTTTKFEREMHITASSPLADRVKALRGKKIGITGPGSGTAAFLTYLFKTNGLNADTDSVQVNLGSNNSAALSALSTGRVDALSFFSPIGQAAEAQGIGDILISPNRGDIPSMDGELLGVFYANQDVIQSKAAAIRAFIRAIAQAEAFIHNDPAQSLALLKSYLGMSQSIVQATFTTLQPIMAQTPQVNRDAYEKAVQFHLKAGLLKTAPDYNTLVATTTIASALNDKSP